MRSVITRLAILSGKRQAFLARSARVRELVTSQPGFRAGVFRNSRARRTMLLALSAQLALLVVAGVRDVPLASAQTGNVTITKELVDANGNAVAGNLSGYVFTLTPTGGGTALTLPPTNAQGRTTAQVAIGSYTAGEQARSGATLVGFFTEGVPTVSFSVTANQATALTARNRVAGTGTIAFAKSVMDAAGNPVAGDRSGFQFTVSGPNGFNQTVTTEPNSFASLGNLADGTYTITEQARAGFTFQSFSIRGVTVSNGATVTLSNGETVAVSVTNRVAAATNTVTITKQLVDTNNSSVAGDRSGFQFTVACGASFSQSATSDANGVATVNNVPAGTCTLTETARSGFTFAGTFVGTNTADIGNGGTFTVTAGAATTITVRNRSGGTTGATEQIPLFSGCNNVTSTYPSGTSISVIASNISPTSSLNAIWFFNNAQQRFLGFSPLPGAPSDLMTVNRSDPLFICMNSGGTFTRPTI